MIKLNLKCKHCGAPLLNFERCDYCGAFFFVDFCPPPQEKINLIGTGCYFRGRKIGEVYYEKRK